MAMELRISEHDEAGRDIAAYVSPLDSDRIEYIVGLIPSFPSLSMAKGITLITSPRLDYLLED